MGNQVIIDEESLIDLCAKTTLNFFIAENLLKNLIGSAPTFAEREALIDKFELLVREIRLGASATERDAVIASDITVRIRELGDNIAGRLRSGLLPSANPAQLPSSEASSLRGSTHV